MSSEGQTLDQKSLRYALGKHEDADGLACDCVGFANAAGGTILLGIKVLRPAQPNRTYDIVAKKFRRSSAGETKGWGLKVFP